MFRRNSAQMRKRVGGVIATSVLCGIAATVGVWSGPLAAASSDLRSAAGTAVSHQAAPARSTTSTTKLSSNSEGNR
jgi:hypothetical protein